VLLHLEVKEFTVEPSTLITVQHLIQWTVTFVLKILTNLSDWRKGAMVLNILFFFSFILLDDFMVFSTSWCAIQNCLIWPENYSSYSESGVSFVIHACLILAPRKMSMLSLFYFEFSPDYCKQLLIRMKYYLVRI